MERDVWDEQAEQYQSSPPVDHSKTPVDVYTCLRNKDAWSDELQLDDSSFGSDTVVF